MTIIARSLALVLILGAVPVPGLAQARAPDLSEMSIEDLINIEVTSASRKEQRAADVARRQETIGNHAREVVDLDTSLRLRWAF